MRPDVLHSMRDNFTELTGHPIAFLDEAGRVVVAASSNSEAMLVIERSLDALRERVGDRTRAQWRLSAELTITRRKYGSFLVEYQAPILFGGHVFGQAVAYGRPSRGMLSNKEEILDVDACDEFSRALESAENLPPLSEDRAARLLPNLVGAIRTIIEYGLNARVLDDSLTRSLNLHRASQFLVSTLDLPDMLDQIVRLAAATLRVHACSLRLLDASRAKLVIAAVHNLSEGHLGTGQIDVARSLIDREALSGRSMTVYDVGNDPRVTHPTEMAAEGIASLLCVPLRVKEQSIGVLRAYSSDPREFTRTDIRIFEALGNQAASAIENARLFAAAKESQRRKHEMEFAARIQRGLLPQAMPKKKGYEFAALSLPHDEVGGDFYDFVEIPNGHMGLVMADGAGKGVPAALLMASAHAALEVQIETTFRTEDIVSRLNQFLCRRIRTGSFVTLFYGALDLRKRLLTYTLAGHPPPLVIRDDDVIELQGEGLILGVSPDATYAEHQFRLQRDDTLVLYTDGVIEAVDPQMDAFGEDRLRKALRENATRSARALAEAVHSRVIEHTAGRDLNDDFTLTVTKLT